MLHLLFCAPAILVSADFGPRLAFRSGKKARKATSIESTAACLFSRSGVTAPIADPFLGLEGRNFIPQNLV
jgi:hypothetical protein